MEKFISKPYKLINTIQHYEWGSKNEEAFIPQFLGVNPERDKPYAELWIGAHPKAPSKIQMGNSETTLNDFIEKFPIEILGKRVAEKYNSKLPFLLKVLSARKALSIQTHPNKSQAEELHKKDPINYPDDNHKPEIAIAINSLNALVGFKPIEDILQIFEEYKSLSDLIGKNIVDQLKVDEGNIKKLYSILLEKNEDEIKPVILSIKDKIENKKQKLDFENQFLNEFNEYGFDVGLFSILLFNYVTLKSDEGIFTDAGVPHAYLKGNIIECMANSDNVVRAGLTPKFKDIKTLIGIMNYSTEKPKIIGSEKMNQINYLTPAEEFSLSISKICNEFKTISTNNSVIVLLVTEGEITITVNNENYSYTKGECVLIPAQIDCFRLEAKKPSKIVTVDIPE